MLYACIAHEMQATVYVFVCWTIYFYIKASTVDCEIN